MGTCFLYCIILQCILRIVKAVLDDLLINKGLINATDIIISGNSAGGLATYLHSDWIKDYLLYSNNIHKLSTNKIKCFISALPESGMFLDYNGYNPNHLKNFGLKMRWVFENANMSYGTINQQCIKHFESLNMTSNCIFVEYLAPFMKIDLFAINSQLSTLCRFA